MRRYNLRSSVTNHQNNTEPAIKPPAADNEAVPFPTSLSPRKQQSSFVPLKQPTLVKAPVKLQVPPTGLASKRPRKFIPEYESSSSEESLPDPSPVHRRPQHQPKPPQLCYCGRGMPSTPSIKLGKLLEKVAAGGKVKEDVFCALHTGELNQELDRLGMAKSWPISVDFEEVATRILRLQPTLSASLDEWQRNNNNNDHWRQADFRSLYPG